MTTFVSRNDNNLGVGRIFTSPTAYALYENLFAFAEKAAGAPVLANSYVVNAMIADGAVTAAKIGANAVTTAKFNTGVRSFSGVVSSGGGDSTTVTMSDQYAFLPRITTGGNIEARVRGTNRLTIIDVGASGGSWAITWRYVA